MEYQKEIEEAHAKTQHLVTDMRILFSKYPNIVVAMSLVGYIRGFLQWVDEQDQHEFVLKILSEINNYKKTDDEKETKNE